MELKLNIKSYKI